MPGTLRRQETSRELVLDPVARLKTLSDHGRSVQIDKTIPVKRYLRSGSEMERQARVYYTEGQWDRAFMLYNKFATLFIEKLPKHPDYSKASGPDKARIKKLLKEAVLPRAMDVKEKLRVKYEKEREDMERVVQEESDAQGKKERSDAQARRDREEQLQKQTQEQAEEVAKFLQGEGGVVVTSTVPTTSSQTIDDEEPSGNVAMETEPSPGKESPEIMEYPSSSEVVMEPGQQVGQGQPDVAHSGTRDSPIEIDRAVAPTRDDLTSTDPRLAQVLPIAPATAGIIGTQTTPYQVQPFAPPSQSPAMSQQAPLPSAPPGNVAMYQPPPPPSFSAYQAPPPNYLSYQPAPPPYNPMVVSPATPPVAVSPALQQPTYEKSIFQAPFANTYTATPTSETTGWTSSPTTPATPTSPPMVDRSTKSDSLKTDCWTAGVDGYRPLFIPMDTAAKFQEVASPNTRRNVETCGILAGKLSHNTLRITHVIVPKQKGKADSCETLNEEELFDVQDQYDLITLGWIHTHPTQTAFMSSVDLHCHCSYQVMMDEAVAIVVAPKYKQVGYYMLTEPHGLNYITHCEEEGFHVHPKVPPLYEDCKHVHHDQNTFIQIVDLR